jgi:deazaflavin-dependent oxidoreductase (nitroreductase family)
MRGATALHTRRYRKSKGAKANTIKGMPLFLLTVPGRKTGTPHTTPVCFFDDDGAWVVCGSAGGQPAEPQWFRNLRAADSAIVEIGGRTASVSVRIVDAGEERERLWQRLVSLAPFFAGYQKKTDRLMPLAVLTPNG